MEQTSKQGMLLGIKGSIDKGINTQDITILNVHVPNKGMSMYFRQKQTARGNK